ncbi:hypothetical protein L1987_48492 [Smallanthus sonchifolius]|uniref:Uncharacterized protein n=1 Tax=Smallanthus sonchifolius TaxID=185202 RepID=A0ACB9FSR8_9ASTR|nr:hypothetical protein L1987_48492 [Smallanthus sonchifolius]
MFQCGKEGHIQRDCPQSKKDGNGNGNNSSNNQGNDGNNNKQGNNNGGNHGNNGENGTKGRAFVLRSGEARYDNNVITEAKYTIEIADGQIIEATHILKGRKLEFVSHELDIDLMPVTLSSFDVIVGMDWVSKNQAEIICHEQICSPTSPEWRNPFCPRRKE